MVAFQIEFRQAPKTTDAATIGRGFRWEIGLVHISLICP
jgi:hypothetical protein